MKPYTQRRYLGLELSGAKNDKTTLAVVDYYPKEKKIFLVDLLVNIGTGDTVLLDAIRETTSSGSTLAVNVPLSLPPCLPCPRKSCASVAKCTLPAVKWMRDATQRASRRLEGVKEFTPYTQRPVELWIKYSVLPELPERLQFEMDETMGGNRAPLTARMTYLARHLNQLRLLEILPKLTLAVLAHRYEFDFRTVANYRKMEEGALARRKLVDHLVREFGIFIYDRDARILSHSLGAFDAFLCAFTALLKDDGLCTAPPKGFPKPSGWIEYPHLQKKKKKAVR